MTYQDPQQAAQQIVNLMSQGHDALDELVQAVNTFPSDGRLRFLLGSLLAGRQQYEEAANQMAFATRLEPGLEIAHFQLGSLRMTSGDGPGALQAWLPLQALPESHPLKCFKLGCEALIADQFEEALHWLRRGITLNTELAPLNHDMQLLVDQIVQLTTQQVEPIVAEGGSQHLLIHGYQSNQGEADDEAALPTGDSTVRH